MAEHVDIAVLGGGHNALVAAAYLARAGASVLVLEAADHLGGAAVSARVFPGVDARLSRYSYLVSLLPERIVDELGLSIELRSRAVSSYTPVGDGGLLVAREFGSATSSSFAALTGGAQEAEAWQQFYAETAEVARIVEPSLTGPLPRAEDVRARLPLDVWTALVERPIGELIEQRFGDDTVRGVVLTDALIGTDTYAHDPSLRQNRCFLYHLIGRGTGEWTVPVGGMGTVTAELARAAAAAGADLRTGARVVAVQTSGGGSVRLTLADGSMIDAERLLAGCAPAVLDRLRGRPAVDPEGSQTKVNLLLRRLPRFRSGVDPEVGFAGTLHLAEGYTQLQTAYEQAHAGKVPDPLPAEAYCHTLTDASILGAELVAAGYQTLTLFALHTPARLFRDDPGGARVAVRDAALRTLQSALAEPLEDCLAVDGHGEPCVEVRTPLDIEAELTMPGGHIFHGDLSWPWLDDSASPRTAAERWGVATDDPRILLCGSGSVRGGAVSGLGGHSAAMAVLEGG